MRALTALVALLALLLAAHVDAVEPQGDTGAHDPTLLIRGERWFVFTTGRGLQRLESADAGKTWHRMAPVFSETPAWWADAVPEHQGLDVWAPKVFQHRGRTWLLYSISTFGKNRSAIGLASSRGWTSLATPGMLVGVLGYAIGTFIGVALFQVL